MRIKNTIVITLLSVGSFVFAQTEDINKFDAKGNRIGLWKGTYPKSNRPRYEGNFINGKESGVFKYFDDTKAGKVIATRDFSSGDGTAYVTFFDQKGNKVSEGKINANKEHQGKWVYYHKESPQIMMVENYKNGKLDGEVTVFYLDGKINSQTQYVNGVKEGVFKSYTNNGDLLEKITYKNNQFNGPVTFYENGKIISDGVYEKGLKIGIWKYYEDGKLTSEVDEEAKRKSKK